MNANQDTRQMIADAEKNSPAYFTKDSKVGAKVGGVITKVTVAQVREYKTNTPLFWDDGVTPQEQFIVQLETDRHVKTSVYIKWWGPNRRAFVDAISEAGATDITLGDSLTVTYDGVEEEDKAAAGMSRRKLFSYKYELAK